MSGIHLYVAKTTGIRRKRRTRIVSTTSRQTSSWILSVENIKRDNTTYADRGIVEIGEWDDGTNVDESGTIEQQINDVGENGVFGVFVKESVPCKR